jgi:hypothetical protein
MSDLPRVFAGDKQDLRAAGGDFAAPVRRIKGEFPAGAILAGDRDKKSQCRYRSLVIEVFYDDEMKGLMAGC